MPEGDDQLDALASAENRRDLRRAAIITSAGIAMVTLASAVAVLGGIPA